MVPAKSRPPLRRDGVVAAALALADAGGIDAVSMRKVGDELGVEAMSLYHHVAGKGELLDAMVDAVHAEFALPVVGDPWRAAMHARATSTRAVLTRHPWATALLDSRPTPGPATLRHLDASIGVLRAAGFPLALTAHALSLLDAYTYGFALQEAAIPADTPEETAELAADLLGGMPVDEFPHLAELAAGHVLQPGYDHGDDFAWGLDLLLDGLEQRVRAEG